MYSTGRAHKFSRRAYIAILIMLTSCTVAPSEEIVKSVITSHFEGRQYKVLNLTIGNIAPTPMGQKQYMGTEGYIISIPSITIEFLRDSIGEHKYRRGQYITFHNAEVSMRKRTVDSGEWIITEIRGIPVI